MELTGVPHLRLSLLTFKFFKPSHETLSGGIIMFVMQPVLNTTFLIA